MVSTLHRLFGDLSLTDMSKIGVLRGQTRARSTPNLSACGGDESNRRLKVTRFTDRPAFGEVNTPFAAENLSPTSPGSSTESPLPEDEFNHAFSAMTLIGLLPRRDVTRKSYALFHVIMHTPVSYDFTAKKWKTARLTLHGVAYKWDKSLPWVKGPRDILAFPNITSI